MARVSAKVDFSHLLDEGATALLRDTPDESLMQGYAEEVQDKYLKGMSRHLSVDNANVEDVEEFVKEVMANVADSEGIKATVADVEGWASMTYDELMAAGNHESIIAMQTTAASAQASLDVAGKVYGESYSLFSLSAGALEDGKISAGEAVQLGASAVSMAGTLISGVTGGMALGPIGAIAGLIMGGINFLTSSSAAAEAYWERKEAMARAAAEKEKLEIDNYLREEAVKWDRGYELMWNAKDRAVAEIADSWSAFESNLGVRFGLRYFMGSPPPPRAGTYKKLHNPKDQIWYYGKYDIVKENKIWVNRAHTCKSPGGCLYFPEPSHAREQALGSYAKAYVEMLEELAAKYEFLWNPNSSEEQQERQYAQQPNYPGFDYYARTIRAFDSYLVPEKMAFEELTDGKMRFWKPPNERLPRPDWRDYRTLAVEWMCNEQNWARDYASEFCKCRVFMNSKGKCKATETAKAKAFEEVVQYYKYVGAGGGSDPALWQRALDHAETMHEALHMEANAVGVFKTRIMGDLIQTSNAVSGELSASVRLEELFSQFGTRSISELSADDKRKATAVSSSVMSKIARADLRDNVINGGVFTAGLAAVGFGAYKKWG